MGKKTSQTWQTKNRPWRSKCHLATGEALWSSRSSRSVAEMHSIFINAYHSIQHVGMSNIVLLHSIYYISIWYYNLYVSIVMICYVLFSYVFILIALGCWDFSPPRRFPEIVSCYMYPGWNWTENSEKLTFGASQTACNWAIEGDFEGVPFAFYPALSVFVELTDHIWPWIPSSTVAVQDTNRWTGAFFFRVEYEA